jgi:ankyrin repeat protein
LRDSRGRTFLHVAVKGKRYGIVAFACRTPALSPILNRQDGDGNTALHLAVEVGDWWVFACLFINKQVDLNLANNGRDTPRELCISSIPTGLYCFLVMQFLHCYLF